MLKTLYIQDYALIDELRIDFEPGLNILTGETGVGKSIIIGALSLLLGERANKEVIRSGASKTVVEGIFDPPSTSEWNDIAKDIETDADGLILRREIHSGGRSRAFANDSPISNTLLTAIGDLLIDLHGQHAHQHLLKVERHLDVLDNFAGKKALLNEVRESYKSFRSLTLTLEQLVEQASQIDEKRELLSFQVQEIENAEIAVDEEETLLHEEKLLRSSERLHQTVERIADMLYVGDGSVSERLVQTENELSALSSIDQQFEEWKKECSTSRITIEELVKSLQGFVSRIEFNPTRLEEVSDRLGLLSRLKKKYGGSLEEAVAFCTRAKTELDRMENLESDIESVSQSLEEEKNRLSRMALQLSLERKQSASILENSIVGALRELGLEKGVFRVRLDAHEDLKGPIRIEGKPVSVTRNGFDRVEFFISLNPGETVKPLAKIASGGEVSRIMLALKSVLAEADEVPILVFDEIDTGISGRIARVVGKKLHGVSHKRQVVCITHLPQIASLGNAHYCVEKEVRKSRSFTTIRKLNPEERVNEIAKLLGGEKITDATRKTARELLNE